MRTALAISVMLSLAATAPGRARDPVHSQVPSPSVQSRRANASSADIRIETTPVKTLNAFPERFEGEIAVGPVRVKPVEQTEQYGNEPAKTLYFLVEEGTHDAVGTGDPIWVYAPRGVFENSIGKNAASLAARAYLRIVKRKQAPDGTPYYEALLTRIEWIDESGKVVETVE